MEGFTYLRTFNYEANLIYCVGQLKHNDINCRSTIEKSEEGKDVYLLFVVDEYLNSAKEQISNMNIEDEILLNDSEGYIQDHVEWSNKMFDQGYYTGGRIPHFYLDKKNWKYFVIYFIGGGLGQLYLIISTDSDGGLFALGYLAIGVSMIIQLWKRRKDKNIK